MLHSTRPLAPALSGHPIGAVAPAPVATRCRLCECTLDRIHGDSLATRLCRDCGRRPEARNLGPASRSLPPPTTPRAFGAADKALIRSVHGYMPAAQLLGVLNARLVADDEHAKPFTLEQLQTEVHALAKEIPSGGNDWASLRKTLASARAAGLLATITEQAVQDFCVVFSLTPAQAVRLKDILAGATDEGDDA